MQEMYPYVKNAHIFFITLSIILFNLRFFLRTKQPEKPLHTVLKVLPHINDSLLLFSGMLMMQIIPWKLFGDYNWLGTKLILVVTYIVLGAMCLRSQPRSRKWFTMYVLAMLCVLSVVYLARVKPI